MDRLPHSHEEGAEKAGVALQAIRQLLQFLLARGGGQC